MTALRLVATLLFAASIALVNGATGGAAETTTATTPSESLTFLVLQGNPLEHPPGVSDRDGGETGMVSASPNGQTSSRVIWGYGDTCREGYPCWGYGVMENSYSLGVPSLTHHVHNVDSSGFPTNPLVPCDSFGSSRACYPVGFSNQPNGSTIGFAQLVDKNPLTQKGLVAFEHAYASEGNDQAVQIFDENDCKWMAPFQGADGNSSFTYLAANHNSNSQSQCPPPNPSDPDEVIFARVPVGYELDRSYYEFYDAQSQQWSADPLDASSNWSPENGSRFADGTYGYISWNPYLNKYFAIVGGCAVTLAPWCGNEITYATSTSVEGPWSMSETLLELPMCTPVGEGGNCGFGKYAFVQQPELQSADGRVLGISYSDGESGEIRTAQVIINPAPGALQSIVAAEYSALTGATVPPALANVLQDSLLNDATLADIQDQIVSSSSGMMVLFKIVDDLYKATLDRSPVGTEVQESWDYLSSSGSWSELEAKLVSSAEYQALHGASTCSLNADSKCLVDAVFDYGFGRQPNSFEIDLFSAMVDQNLWTELELAQFLLVGPNDHSREAANYRVTKAYDRTLERLPTTDEIDVAKDLLSEQPLGLPYFLEADIRTTNLGIESVLFGS